MNFIVFIILFVLITFTIGFLFIAAGRYFIIIHTFSMLIGFHFLILGCNPILFENKEDCKNRFFSVFGIMTNLIRKV
jgi:hypothetical protein